MKEFKWIQGVDEKALDDYVKKTEQMIEKLYYDEEGAKIKV